MRPHRESDSPVTAAFEGPQMGWKADEKSVTLETTLEETAFGPAQVASAAYATEAAIG